MVTCLDVKQDKQNVTFDYLLYPSGVNLLCTMLLFDELGKCPFVGKGSTGEYLVYIVIQSSWAKLVLVLTT